MAQNTGRAEGCSEQQPHRAIETSCPTPEPPPRRCASGSCSRKLLEQSAQEPICQHNNEHGTDNTSANHAPVDCELREIALQEVPPPEGQPCHDCAERSWACRNRRQNQQKQKPKHPPDPEIWPGLHGNRVDLSVRATSPIPNEASTCGSSSSLRLTRFAPCWMTTTRARSRRTGRRGTRIMARSW